jgi:malonate-semialdehyde dehydrogenase (acetylating) / methylmalonate-semialdehyde dehydrogenase
MPDIDLINAVRNFTSSAFGSVGESYMICSAVVAVGDIADELVERLVQAAGKTAGERKMLL